MEILAISSKFDESSTVLLAVLPIIAILLFLYWYEKNANAPKFESLSSAQKVWLFLRSIDPGLAARVWVALGADLTWNYLKGVDELAPQAAGLTGLVCDEFCTKVAEKSELKVRSVYVSTTEFLIDNYYDNANLLAADLCKVWPLVPSQEPEAEKAVESEAEVKNEGSEGSSGG